MEYKNTTTIDLESLDNKKYKIELNQVEDKINEVYMKINKGKINTSLSLKRTNMNKDLSNQLLELYNKKINMSSQIYDRLQNDIYKLHEEMNSIQRDIFNIRNNCYSNESHIQTQYVINDDIINEVDSKDTSKSLKKKRNKSFDKKEKCIIMSKPIVKSKYEDITYKELESKLNHNEAIYCFCQYISFGNMIKCDNERCKKEWFHFKCVGLSSFPKGKWYCSQSCYVIGENIKN